MGESEAAEEFVQTSALKRWCELGVAGGAKFGRDFRAPQKYKEWMIEAGFVDVQEKQILVPVNTWPVDPVDSHIGGWFSLDVQKGVKGTTKLLEAAGLPANEIPGFMDEVCHNVTHRAMRAYSPRKFVQLQNEGPIWVLIVGRLCVLWTEAYVISTLICNGEPRLMDSPSSLHSQPPTAV